MRTSFQAEALGTALAAISGGLLLIMAVAATPAEAKPKIVSNGCTTAQIV